MKEIEKTTNRRVFKILYIKDISGKHGLCPICPPHSGCNYLFGYKPVRNWKYWRKKQYKQ